MKYAALWMYLWTAHKGLRWITNGVWCHVVWWICTNIFNDEGYLCLSL